jgi:quinol monooxygenase YgiN
LEELKDLGKRMDKAPGQIMRYVYQMDADPGEIFLVAVFESKEAYWANANSPEQHQRFTELRALLLEDPQWHDGAIIDTA